MWLGEVITELGYQAVPALRCRRGLELVNSFALPVTALIINPELPGAGRTMKMLADANPGLRVVTISERSAHVFAASADATTADPGKTRRGAVLERPSPCQHISRKDWVEKVRRTLAVASQ